MLASGGKAYLVEQHQMTKLSMPCPAPHPASQPQIVCCAKEQFKGAVKAYGVRGLASKLGITPAYVSMVAGGKRALTPALLTNRQ